MNFQLLKKYCLCKVLLGSKSNDVKNVMGIPYKVKVSGKQKIFIYGENKNSKVNHMIKFSCLAIVLKNNKVNCVFSNYYYPREWIIKSRGNFTSTK